VDECDKSPTKRYIRKERVDYRVADGCLLSAKPGAGAALVGPRFWRCGSSVVAGGSIPPSMSCCKHSTLLAACCCRGWQACRMQGWIRGDEGQRRLPNVCEEGQRVLPD
jgi:hypothetical protein